MARDLSGKVVGAYRLGERIGPGQAGMLYEAEHSASGRRVTVKVFSADFARDKNAAARLVGEVQRATALRHPNLVEVLDVGMIEHKGRRHLYLVMPQLRGETLAARLQRQQQLPLEEVLRVASDVGAALQAIHRTGSRHRALTAEAVFFQRTDAGEVVLLLDLGCSVVLAADPAAAAPSGEDDLRALALLVQTMLGGPAAPGPGSSQPLLPLRLRNPEVPVHVDLAVRRALGEAGAPLSSVAAFVGALLGTADLLPSWGPWSETGAMAPPAARSAMGLGWLAVGALAVLGGGIGLWMYEGPGAGRQAMDLSPGPDLSPGGLTTPQQDQTAEVEPDLAAFDLLAEPDLRPPRPTRSGPPLPPLRGPADFNPELSALVPPAPAVQPVNNPVRPRRPGPPIPPLRP
ncbi:MAG: protein kinase [Myxococcales bacterium]|nr:protein kinase [Myxococcota bacterium]MDW8280569.1 protein kinase [Myxococcales bacterium]